MAQENEYLQLIQSDLTGEIKRSMQVAVDRDPDTEAKLHDLAKRANVPLEAVRLDTKTVERQVQLQALDYEALAKQYPSTAELLADPNNAALAKDDIENMSMFEKLVGAGKRGFLSLNQGASAIGFKSNALAMQNVEEVERKMEAGEPIQDGEDIYGVRLMTPQQREEFKVSMSMAATRQAGDIASLESRKRAIPTDPTIAAAMQSKTFGEFWTHFTKKPFEFIATVGAESLPNMAPGLIAAVPATIAGGPVAGAAVMGGGSFGVDYAGTVLEAMQSEGVDLSNEAAVRAAVADKALMGRVGAKAFAHASVVGAFDAASGGLAGKTLAPAKLASRPMLKNAVNMAVQAPAQGLLGALGEAGGQVAAGGELQAGDIAAEFFGEFVGTPGEVLSMSGRKVIDTMQQARIAKENVAVMQALGEAAGQSKLLERAPERFREFIKKAKEGGEISDVFVPAERFQAFFQSIGVDPAQVAAEAGVKNYQEAIAAGTDVVIPLENYVTSIAPTEYHAGLIEDIRLHQGDMTAREAAQFESEREASMQRLMADAREAAPLLQNDPAVSQIESDILGQLVATGTERGAAETYAKTYAKAIANLAQRSGMDPLALHERYGLTINRPMPDILTNRIKTDINLDPFLDRMRSGDVPTDKDIFGPSLTEFIRSIGGMRDDGGELRRMEVDAQNAPFMRNLIQAGGRAIDEVTALAREAGYQVDDILDAIDQEVRGNPVYSSGNLDEFLLGLRDTVNQLGDYLNSIGIDVNGLTNEQIRQVMDEAIGSVYEQEGGDQIQQLFQRAVGYTDTKLRSDLPLSEQSYGVRYILRNEIKRLRAEAWNSGDKSMDPDTEDSRITGAQLIEIITDRLGSQSEAVAYLTALGITDVIDAPASETVEFAQSLTPEQILTLFNEADTIDLQAPVQTEQEIDDEQNRFLSDAPAGTRYTRTTGLLKRVRKASDEAVRELAGSEATGRRVAEKLGPFTGYRVIGEAVSTGVPENDLLVVRVYGDEQLAQGIKSEPALTFTVSKSGELTVNGPFPSSETFLKFQERGWADLARGADGQPIPGWSSLKNPDSPDGPLPIQQLMPLLADIHARVREWRGEDYVGLYWSRATGAMGGLPWSSNENGTAVYFQSMDKKPKPLTEKQFYAEYSQHVDIRGAKDGKSEENLKSIIENGFKTSYPVNTLSPYRGGQPQNVVEKQFGKFAGKVVYLVPKSGMHKVRGTLTIKDGWKPMPYEVVRPTEDYASMYQEYLKEFNKWLADNENGTAVYFQPAFHGTPYKFDKFSLEHLGKGEGAQAYGWGLYFAGNKEVAEWYRETLATTDTLINGEKVWPEDPRFEAAVRIAVSGYDNALAMAKRDSTEQFLTQQGREHAARLAEQIEQLKDAKIESKKGGALYEVDIPDDGSYLLWDKPLAEQPDAVQAALKEIKLPDPKNMDGREIYSFIKEVMAERSGETGTSPAFYNQFAEEASKYLHSLGIAGIKYLDGTSRNQNLEQKEAAVRVAEKQLAKAKASGNAEKVAKWEQNLAERQKELEALAYNYVVFDDSAIEIVNRYYQDPTRLNKDMDRDTMRGYIQFGPDRKFNIALLEKADLSTFLHETGHFWLEIMGDLAADPNGAQQIKDDYANILKFLKVESRDQIGIEQHELFARANEAYLREGKAPSPELRSVFQKFKAWLTMIYKSIEMLNVTLTDEVRGVFDRIYASDAEIEAAKNEMDVAQLFATPADAGMTDEEFAVYSKSVAGSIERAKDKLRAKLMRQFQREKTVWWNNELDKLRAEVTKEIDAQPVYQAFDALTKGELPDGTPFKLDKAALVEQFGKNYVKRIPRGYGEGRGAVYSTDGKGLHHDAAADLLGYGSGAELVQALVEMRPRKALIEAEAEQRMIERHGDLMVDGTIADEAVAAMHNEERANLLRTELLAIRKKQIEVAPMVKVEADKAKAQRKQAVAATDTPPVSVFRDAARGMIGQQQVRDIRPYPYLLAERKASKAAFSAMAKGDYQEAAIQKQRELLNHYLYLEATAALETADDIYTYARKFTKGKTRAKFGKAGEAYLEQIDDLLEQYEFTDVSKTDMVRREKLLAFIKEKMEDDEPVMIPDAVLLDAQKRNYKTLPFDHLLAVRDAIKNLEHIVNLKTRLLKVQSQRALEELVAEGVASIEENGTKRDTPVGTKTLLDSAKELSDGYFVAHRKLASILREMDGWQDNGFMWNTIMKPINDAANEKAVRTEDATKKLAKLYEKLQKPGLANKVKGLGLMKRENYPSLGRSLSRADLLALALNYGNDGNRQRIRDGYGWTDQQVLAALNRLEANEWEFVEGMWALIDSYWPEIEAQYKRINGVAPPKVDKSPFILPNGRRVEGGYYPIGYDERHSIRANNDRAKEEAERIMRGAVARPHVDTGFTETRAGQVVDRKIKLDLGVGLEHIDTVLQTLTHQDMLIDLLKILGSPKLSGAIADYYGMETYDAIKAALTDITAGEVGARDAYGRIMSWLRSGVTIAGMGLNLSTALMQPLGITQSTVRIGAKWMLRGLTRFAGTPSHMEAAVKFVYDRSDMMRLRSKTMNREISEIRNKVSKGGVMPKFEETYFYAIVKMQAMVDVPTWLGAYEKYMEQTGNDEKQAIALADQAVIDAQGGGQTKDLAAIQRGDPFKKLFTTFYSYFSATWNLTVESAGRTDFKKVDDVGRFAVDMLLLYSLPALLGAVLKEAVKGGEGPDDDEALMAWLARNQFGYLLGSLVGVRELGSAVQGMYGYSGPAGTRFFSEAGKLVTQAGQGEADMPFAKALNNTLGILFHYPAGQLQRTAEGFMALKDGSTSNPTVLIFGPRKDD